MEGEVFKRRLVHNVAVTIANFVHLLKCFVANVLRCKACLKVKFKCISITMRSLVISLSHVTS